MKAAIVRYLPLLLLAIVWEALPRLGLIDRAQLPPPSEIAVAWLELFRSGDLVTNGMSSLLVLIRALSLSIVVGIFLGVMMARFPALDDIFGPLLKALYPVPKSALIPIMIIWFGLGVTSKIASVFLGCLLPIVTSTYYGAKGVEQTLIWSSQSVGARPIAVIWDVVIPAAMPDILAGIRNAIAIGFILLVSAELLIGQVGIGYLISFLGEGGLYAGMFAAILTISAAGFLADRLFVLIMKRALIWRQ
jgi:NitT/TauT family transport system permease protein